ncbi:helix-turn-helix domain-containing protein [Streptomonospora litoralis]|uniref:Helix-turn-helix domain protein n=1 Tax=Streptomonospora litoralis TaxID=2498135 RepID=A0A4P6PZJ9_9ACTN|nr:helix-turn-helix domain-containing protein [Streptomonospora litoralis]QBI51959.1 Helix-turn-helix domain protein [Streptomonospora litoralis]
MYAERSAACGGVVWSAAAATAAAGECHRVVPDGCMDLIWDGERVLLAGPDTRAHFADWAPGRVFAGVRLPVGVGPAVAGAPARALRDLRVPLEDVWPAAEARRLAAQAAAAPDAGAPLERAAGRRLQDGPGADPLMARVAVLLDRNTAVSQVARETGLGERGLHRRSLAAFGYGPKTLGRILRLDRALAAAREGTPFAEVAALAGYADQAHLSREAKQLAGAPLSVLTAHAGDANRSTQLPSGSSTIA